MTERYLKYKWKKNYPFEAKTDDLFGQALDLHNRAYFRNAISWYKRIFEERGDARGACNIGCIFARDHDFERAKVWFEKASRMGRLPTAQFNLGLIAEKENNFPEATYWYARAAHQDYYLAEVGLKTINELERNFREEAEKNNKALMVLKSRQE